MNRFRKYLVMFALVFMYALASPIYSYAQGPGDPGCDPLDPACPVDGGVGLLIIIGIGFAGVKAYQLKKLTKETV